MATYTTVGICNHALVLCGASPITALTDDSANARALNAVFENARKGFLTECRWTFALTRSTLATVSTSGLVPFYYDDEAYVYDRPSNALRIWEMSDIAAMWREEGTRIISNTASLGTLYTWDHSEIGLWRPKATVAFMDKLCSDICFMILNSATKAQAFLEKYQRVSLPAAMAEESQTGAHQQIQDDAWLKAKYSGGGNPARSYD